MDQYYYRPDSAGNLVLVNVPAGESPIPGDIPADSVDPREFLLASGKLVEVGSRPSEFAEYVAGNWAVNMQAVRNARDARLAASDWTQLPDVPLATKEAWATYRQALRDITLQPDPFNIVWPTPPS